MPSIATLVLDGNRCSYPRLPFSVFGSLKYSLNSVYSGRPVSATPVDPAQAAGFFSPLLAAVISASVAEFNVGTVPAAVQDRERIVRSVEIALPASTVGARPISSATPPRNTFSWL